MSYQVTLSPLAQKDLESIEQYISEDNPDAAKRLCDKLLTAAESLNSFPHRGNRANPKQVHTLTCKPYVIFYDIDESAGHVDILRFWHGAQHQRRLRLKEDNLAYLLVETPTP